MSEYRDIIGEAYGLVTLESRTERMKKAHELGRVIYSGIKNFDGHDMVSGEAGVPDWDKAVDSLMGKATLHPIEAWMLAELVATGTVTAHQLFNVEAVSEDCYDQLTEHLALGALKLAGSPYRSTLVT